MGNFMSRIIPKFLSFFKPSGAMPALHEVITPTRILVLGGSYGGLSTALNLHDLCSGKQARVTLHKPAVGAPGPRIPIEITIVDERDGYYHLIGSPLALASESFSKKAWVKFDDLPALRSKNITHLQGSATSVNCEQKVAIITDSITGRETRESYDYLVVSTGLRRVFPTVPQSLTRKAYLFEAEGHIQKVKNAREGVVVIGGGAVGIEMAAELKLVEPNLAVTLVHSRDKLLSSEPLPDEFKDRSALVLQEQGVKLILGHRVMKQAKVDLDDGTSHFKLTMSDGSEMLASHVIWAISKSIPSTTFLPEHTLNEEGYVKINGRLNFLNTVPDSEHHFVVGDAAAWSGIKRCGAAMAMGHIAAANIHQQLLHRETGKAPEWIEFPVVSPMIALAVGKQAVMYGEEDGTTWGEENMKMMFGNDLGFTICWNYLGLGKESDY